RRERFPRGALDPEPLPAALTSSAGVSRHQAWPAVLTLFAITSLVEAIGFGHVIRFLPLYLRVVGTPAAQVPVWTGLFSALVYLTGLPLIPFWGVWAEKYSRKAVIARSAFVEAAVVLVLGTRHSRS